MSICKTKYKSHLKQPPKLIWKVTRSIPNPDAADGYKPRYKAPACHIFVNNAEQVTPDPMILSHPHSPTPLADIRVSKQSVLRPRTSQPLGRFRLSCILD